MQPLIGITGSIIERNNNRYIAAYEPNAKAIIQAGGLPIVIPCDLDPQTLRAIYERVDGVLLPGGGDIDPEFYGATPHEKTALIIRERDIAEIQIAKWAVADDLPMFGICRGHQVFNVAMGGTLYQDIPSELRTQYTHDIEKGMPRSTLLHDVKIAPNSKLATILKTEQIRVNSLHHQAVMTPADTVQVTAYAPDGVIEASELPNKRFILTVQWHPEDLQDMSQMRDLFKAFVDAAREKSLSNGR
ncbi:MAG: gamma-glutamyl-gamma-aminobutyrate hydrolase [Phototrophicales bacterium]|nr:MAG: gamma-glutamyl-gamma-aminobutyrate hydrolase [Phototrophicales bacterium]